MPPRHHYPNLLRLHYPNLLRLHYLKTFCTLPLRHRRTRLRRRSLDIRCEGLLWRTKRTRKRKRRTCATPTMCRPKCRTTKRLIPTRWVPPWAATKRATPGASKRASPRVRAAAAVRRQAVVRAEVRAQSRTATKAAMPPMSPARVRPADWATQPARRRSCGWRTTI